MANFKTMDIQVKAGAIFKNKRYGFMRVKVRQVTGSNSAVPVDPADRIVFFSHLDGFGNPQQWMEPLTIPLFLDEYETAEPVKADTIGGPNEYEKR